MRSMTDEGLEAGRGRNEGLHAETPSSDLASRGHLPQASAKHSSAPRSGEKGSSASPQRFFHHPAQARRKSRSVAERLAFDEPRFVEH